MQQIIVCDGFYSNPQQMRSLFSTLDYAKNENILGGSICPMNFANEEMLSQIHLYLGAPENTFEFVEGSGTFVINQKDQLSSQKICTNFPDISTQWIGIICLSEAEEPHFLKFYRNKRTGWDGVPNSIDQLLKENIQSFDDFQMFVSSENQNGEWVETSRVEYKFNQLILFRPGSFHSYDDVYGDSQETGRLLQFFFLKPNTKV